MKDHVSAEVKKPEAGDVFPCLRIGIGIWSGNVHVFLSEKVWIEGAPDGVKFFRGNSDRYENMTNPAPDDWQFQLTITAGDGTEFPRVTRSFIGSHWLHLRDTLSVKVSGPTPFGAVPIGRLDADCPAGASDPLPPDSVSNITFLNKGEPSERIRFSVEETPQPSSAGTGWGPVNVGPYQVRRIMPRLTGTPGFQIIRLDLPLDVQIPSTLSIAEARGIAEALLSGVEDAEKIGGVK